jgi:Ca2+-binding RTX toxin-like protein
MPDINIANFGSQSTNGTTVESVFIAEDGAIYMAGCTNSGIGTWGQANLNPTIWCYRDKKLVWKKVFEGKYAYESFNDIDVIDGYVYASGGTGFRSDNALPGIVWPTGKDTDELNNGTVVGKEEVASFFVKLTSDGTLVRAQAVENNMAGSLMGSTIACDSAGNLYVTSPFAGLYSYDANGNFRWHNESGGGNVKLIKKDLGNDAVAENLFAVRGDYIVELNMATGGLVREFSPEIGMDSTGSIRDFVIDEDGNIFVGIGGGKTLDQVGVNTDKPTLDQISAYAPVNKFVIRKFDSGVWDASEKTPSWETTLKIQGWASTQFQGSIKLTPDGKIIVAGSTIGDLNDEKAFGTYDAFYTILNDDGGIFKTKIIGTVAYPEAAATAVYDAESNLYLAGEFNSKSYSLKDSGFQNVYLISEEGFTLMGDDADNIIQGGGGSDIISAGIGDDLLIGGLGKDSLVGGNGADELYGGDGDDTVIAGAGNDEIVGGDGAGNDKYDGGDGIDTIKYRSALKGIVVNLSVKKDHARSRILGDAAEDAGIGVDQLSGIENVIGGNYSDILFGNSSVNILSGEIGSDVIDGGQGADDMWGGAGDDIYYVDNVNDQTNEAVSAINTSDAGGIELVYSSVTRTLGNYLENLTLVGTKAVNGTGNALANTINGNSASNILYGGAGSDTLMGGAGNDTYVVDDLEDTIIDAAGVDLISSSITWTLGQAIENLTLTGTGNINATGNGLSNILTGNSGNNILDGGVGADKLFGGLGNDTYIVDNAKDVVTEKSGEGSDSIQTTLATYSIANLAAIENLTYTGGGSAVLTGNAVANSLTGAGGADRLIGGKGADVLVGGAGLDTFVFAAGDSGQQEASIDKILDYSKGALNVGDLIDHFAKMTIGGDGNASLNSKVSINQQSGVASFAVGPITTLSDAVTDIAARFTSSKDAAGEFALFQVNVNSDYYVFISDGKAGVTANDVVIQLTGVSSIGSIDLTGGNLTIVS